MSLDLDKGDEDLADASPSERRRAARAAADEAKRQTTKSSSSKPSSSRSKAATQAKVETELDSRLGRVFDRIAVALEQRGDDELASIIRDDAGAMSQGLVSLTRGVAFLRAPLLMLLNLVEPVLAFGRVARVMYNRYAMRQYERRMAAQQEAESSSVAATQ